MAGPWEKYQATASGPWEKYAPPPAEATATPRDVSPADMIAQGASFGLSDEVAAAGGATGAALKVITDAVASGNIPSWDALKTSASEAYDRRLKEVREGMKQFHKDNPVAGTALEVAGGVATGGTLAKGGATLLNAVRPTYPNMIARGAAEGTLYGGAYGFGTGEGGLPERVESAGRGATTGTVTGGVTGAVGARMAQSSARKAIPTTEVLRDQADNAYTAARQAGVVFEPQGFAQAVDDIASTVKTAGIDKTIHPKATAAIGRLEEMKGAQPSFDEVELLRRVAGAAAKSNDADERRIASIIVDKIDDYVGGAPPVVSGDPVKASEAVTQARDLWKRMRKTETIENLVERAQNRASQFTGSGYENALRTEFRSLAQNAKKMRGFTEAEQTAIRRVARGGPIENILRRVGAMAVRGPVSGGFHLGVGAAVDPTLGAATLVAGEAGRRGATALTARNANVAGQLMRAGGTLPGPGPISPQQLALLETLLVTGAQQGPQVGDLLSPPRGLLSSGR